MSGSSRFPRRTGIERVHYSGSGPVIGAALDGVYVLIGGHRLLTLLQQHSAWSDRARSLVALGAVLLLIVPTAAAVLEDLRKQGKLDVPFWRGKRIPLRYVGRVDPTPTAWDFAAIPQAGTFVRIRLDKGVWTGGWIGTELFLSTWPESRDIFIESQWRLDDEGKFLDKVKGTRGVYVSCAGPVVVEWVDPPSDDPKGTGDV